MNENNFILCLLPNILTLFRSCAAIILPLIIIYGGEIRALIATPILILAGVSDYFDGFFARKYKVVSNFCKYGLFYVFLCHWLGITWINDKNYYQYKNCN